ncbi:MAG TPA: dipeptidase [Thermoanaerobaculia bacterium]|nr:dipeptidase [Thermoanaerobaculia bacterium]
MKERTDLRSFSSLKSLLSLESLLYARTHQACFLAELKQFIRFPSVSAQSARAGDVRKCAAWLAAHLQGIGMAGVQVIPTPRHPIVYAEWRGAPGKPTVLIYGHYDVQPPDPLREWTTPPFEPTVRGPHLYGRGATDDKGQLFCHVKALESLLRKTHRLPVNVKCLFEGEEEIGSPNLKPFLERHRRALTADAAVMSDTRMLGPERPALTYSLRGGLSQELTVCGPRQDLHSGTFGGAIHNPAQVLCEIVAGLHDAQGRVSIPGFYDRVLLPGPDERASMKKVGPPDAKILADAGAPLGWGEPGWSLHERTTVRPSLAVTGLTAGYQGEGSKAVIPSRASAKLNFRLVPEQDPREIDLLVRRHVARAAPPTVRFELTTQARARPAVLDRRHPVMRAAARAYQRGFGAAPVFLRSGGSIPIVSTLQEILGLETALLGFALPDSQIHAPNERLHLPTFARGIATCLAFLEECAALPRRTMRRAPAATVRA